jgi:catalase
VHDPSWKIAAAEMGRYAYRAHADDDDFVQARTLYRNAMSLSDRNNLVANVADNLHHGVSFKVLRRAIDYWRRVDAELGEAIAYRIGMSAADAA